MKIFRFQINVLLLNCALVCIIECIFNCLLSVIYILTQPWSLGIWPCYINSFLMEFVPMMYTVLLVLLGKFSNQISKIKYNILAQAPIL